MGTPLQTGGTVRVDKSHKADLSDIVFTGRDPRPKNLPISRDRSYQNDIILARIDLTVTFYYHLNFSHHSFNMMR